VLAIGVWTAGTAFVLFSVLKRTVGLRVSAEEELAGLDVGEHGTVAYPDLAPIPSSEPSAPAKSAATIPSSAQ
jgi:Amt family ammonium transporter